MSAHFGQIGGFSDDQFMEISAANRDACTALIGVVIDCLLKSCGTGIDRFSSSSLGLNCFLVHMVLCV